MLGFRGFADSMLALFSEGPLSAEPCGHSREAEHSLPVGKLPGLLLLGGELQLQKHWGLSATQQRNSKIVTSASPDQLKLVLLEKMSSSFFSSSSDAAKMALQTPPFLVHMPFFP